MGSPTSITTENPQQQRQGGACSTGTPTAATDVVDVAYSEERPSRGPWLSEAPPSGVLTGVLSEMAFYYGAYCLYHRSAQRRGKMR